MTLPKRRFQRYAAATCLLYGAALVLSWVHFATVIHVYCTRHGEIIHLERDTLARLVADYTIFDPHIATLNTSPYIFGVHGCAALDFLTQPKTDGAAGVLASALDASIGEAPTPRADPRRPVLLLFLSPKTSPPAAAPISAV